MSRGGAREHPARGQAPVTVYTLSGCGHCHRARLLLRSRGIEFSEVSGDGDRDFRRRLLRQTGGATVPQVVIHGEPIGGARELRELDRRGVLVARVLRRRFPWAVVRRRRDLRGRFSWLATFLPGADGPGRNAVEVIDGDGRTLDRHAVASFEEGEVLARTLNAERERGLDSEAAADLLASSRGGSRTRQTWKRESHRAL